MAKKAVKVKRVLQHEVRAVEHEAKIVYKLAMVHKVLFVVLIIAVVGAGGLAYNYNTLYTHTSSTLNSTNQTLITTIKHDNAMLSQANFTIANLSYKLNILSGILNSSNATIASYKKSLSTTTSVLNTTKSMLSSNITTLHSVITNLQIQLLAANTTIANLRSELNSNATTIASLQSTITTQQTSISNLQNKLSAANTTISSLQSQLNSANNQMNTLNSQVGTLTSQVSSLQSQISSLDSIVNLQNQTTLANSDQQVLTSFGGTKLYSYSTPPIKYAGYLQVTYSASGNINIEEIFDGTGPVTWVSGSSGGTVIIPVTPNHSYSVELYNGGLSSVTVITTIKYVN